MKEKILIVDDVLSIRCSIAFVLKEAGYNVRQARDGLEALALILESRRTGDPIDLLLTDIQMPRMSGIELVRQLQKRGVSLPVIAVSGSLERGLVRDLLESGCFGVLAKPFSLGELVKKVEGALAGRQRERRERVHAELVT